MGTVKIKAEDHVGLVWKISHDYARRWGVPVDELVGEGTIGLMYALRKFDPNRGTKFSTYAGLWVHAFIGRHLNEGNRLITLPAKVARAMRKAGVLPPPPASMDAVFHHHKFGEDLTFHDLIADERTPSPEDDAARLEEAAIVRRAVGKLPKQSQTVLKLRFIFGQTLEQVGALFRISRQRAQQIEAEALSDLLEYLPKRLGRAS